MKSAWPTRKIKDLEISLIDGDRGKNYPKQDDFSDVGFCLFLNTGNVTTNGFDFSNCAFISKSKDELLRKGKLERSDIILTTRGTVGNVAYFSNKIPYENIRINSGMLIVRANENEFEASFLHQVLCSPLFKEQVKHFQYGAAQPQLPIRTLNHIKLPIPPLPTQRKIASILSAYDDLIENNLKRIKLLEEKAQLTYEEWFVRMKFPGHESTPIDEETGLPEGWERKAIKDMTSLVSGFAFKSKDFVQDGSYKLVTIKNVQEGVFVNNTSDTLSAIPEKVKPEHLLKDGDIIMSLTGNVGRTCMVYGENYLLNQRVLKIQPTYFKSFIYWFLRSEKTIKELENLSNGAAQQNLSPINMGKHKVVVPDRPLLLKYCEVFDVQLKISLELNKQNQLLKEARDILLPRLMSGMIEV